MPSIPAGQVLECEAEMGNIDQKRWVDQEPQVGIVVDPVDLWLMVQVLWPVFPVAAAAIVILEAVAAVAALAVVAVEAVPTEYSEQQLPLPLFQARKSKMYYLAVHPGTLGCC